MYFVCTLLGHWPWPTACCRYVYLGSSQAADCIEGSTSARQSKVVICAVPSLSEVVGALCAAVTVIGICKFIIVS